MADQDEQRPGATQPGGAADRAGALVRDQIASIANAAQAAADQIDEEASTETTEARQQALAAATAIHQGLGAIERELDELLKLVSSRTAHLKRSIDRFDSRGAATAPQGAGPTPSSAPAPEQPTTAAEAPPALAETVDGHAEEAPAAGAAAWAPPEADAPPAAAATQPGTPAAPRTELENEAWSRVKGKDPAELVALYESATGDRDDGGDEEIDWGEYWAAVRQAVLSEVRARPELLAEPPDMPDLSRRERKARTKAFEALRDEVAAGATASA